MINPQDQQRRGEIWIVEDDERIAELAAEICREQRFDARTFASPLPFLRAFSDSEAPLAVVFDWRLEHELTSALYMATRHRFPHLPVIYWTATARDALPGMLRVDAATRIVGKDEGLAGFEAALDWAVELVGQPAGMPGPAAWWPSWITPATPSAGRPALPWGSARR